MSNPELDPITTLTTNLQIIPQEKIAGFHRLIRNASIAMLVTRCESGALHSRAMKPCRLIKREQISLFFIANNVSHKFDELKYDPNVNVSFYDWDTGRWPSVSGIAKVTQDKGLIKEFWTPNFVYPLPCEAPTDRSNRMSSFFGDLKDGKHDGSPDGPRVCSIEVIPSEIRYWVSNTGYLPSETLMPL